MPRSELGTLSFMRPFERGVTPVWLLAKPSQSAMHEMFEMCESPGDGCLGSPHLMRVWIDNVSELHRAGSPVVLHAQVRFIAREVGDAAHQDDVHGGSGEKSLSIWRGGDLRDEVAHWSKRRARKTVEA